MLGLSCQGGVTVGGAASMGVKGCGHLEHGQVFLLLEPCKDGQFS